MCFVFAFYTHTALTYFQGIGGCKLCWGPSLHSFILFWLSSLWLNIYMDTVPYVCLREGGNGRPGERTGSAWAQVGLSAWPMVILKDTKLFGHFFPEKENECINTLYFTMFSQHVIGFIKCMTMICKWWKPEPFVSIVISLRSTWGPFVPGTYSPRMLCGEQVFFEAVMQRQPFEKACRLRTVRSE